MDLQTIVGRNTDTPISDDLELREPIARDGALIWDFIRDCEPLDDNSMYCNLLQCTHFADTCAVALRPGEERPVGWISAYIPPRDPRSLFVWQVAVCESARGEGLASRLVHEVLARDVCAPIKRLRATITSDNDASWGLFQSVADSLGAELRRTPWLRSDEHFSGRHDTEHLVSIGPIDRQVLDAA